ncbi:MAG TPA: DUF5606 domain-containing protein [Saprospiraceae bacterium]|nr:DUF5606 domain-containing protein [Saprospiraceae bacterium]HMP23838.1 DUF5606 domain-containing protein [Saprospiraceae bacterium]
MNLEKLISVTGMAGLYRMTANRTNGLIVEELGSGKRKFAPARKHQFTPLESIGIYTDDGDTTDLKNVFERMLEQQATHPPVSAEASAKELHEYFAGILPNYDRDKVSTGDIKKIVKWFGILGTHGLLTTDETDTEDSPADEEE